MDRGEVCRGNHCVHKVWTEYTAILSGDNMWVIADQLVVLFLVECLKEVIGSYVTDKIRTNDKKMRPCSYTISSLISRFTSNTLYIYHNYKHNFVYLRKKYSYVKHYAYYE